MAASSLSCRGAVALAFAALCISPRAAKAAPKQGDFLHTDTLSMALVGRDFTTETSSNVTDAVNLSGLIGIHYYFVDRVRLGVSMQATARLWPEPEGGASRAQRFAISPQIGWNFADPFFVGALFTYAPRTRGKVIPDMSVSPVVGLSLPITDRLRWSVAIETPYAFYYHRTLTLVMLTGLGVRL
ncbi:MAG: hypothetical protein QM756_25500 [Polyangiaceae bacterium]